MFYYWKKSYQPLPKQEKEEKISTIRKRFTFNCIITLLVISVSANVLFVFQQHRYSNTRVVNIRIPARLPRDTLRSFSVVGHENDNMDEEWAAQNSDVGMLALTDSYVAKMDLPVAQRYPWDLGKGIYYLHGHHNLHCLQCYFPKETRPPIMEYRNQSLQTQHYFHIDHCLGTLLNDIICNADNKPRYTDGNHKQPGSGQGQFRLCRDWSRLDAWANEHSACFRTPENYYDGKLASERFKSCPDGSEPWKFVE